MKFIELFISVLQIAGVFAKYISKSAPKCNGSNFKRLSQNEDAIWSVLKDGDFIIQGIMQLASDSSSCKMIERIGLLSMLSFQFAIHQINKDSSVLPSYRLGYQIDNSCYNIPTVMARGIEIVSQYRPKTVCHVRTCSEDSSATKQITAVIGTQNSFTSIPLASLLGLYKIPLISPTASSRLLSKKSLYPSFFRTIPSDRVQALAIADLLKHFNWRYVYAIGSDDNYGKLGISTMKEHAANRGFCIVADDYISHLEDEMQAKARLIAQRLKDAPNAAVVVVFAYDNQIEHIVKEAENLGLRKVWLMSDAFDLFEVSKIYIKESSIIGMFRVSPINRIVPGLKKFIKKIIATEVQCNKFLELYLKQEFQCKINSTFIYCPNETLESMASGIASYYHFAYGHIIDGVYAVAHALQSLLIKMCKYNQNGYLEKECPPFKNVKPGELTKQLLAVNFTTFYNTTFIFDENGDPANAQYYIENVQKIDGVMEFVPIGQWDPNRYLQLHNKNIVWPIWTKDITPRSACNDDCYPGQHVSARTECCWSCQPCSINHISRNKNMANCSKCPEGSSSNSKGTECVKNVLVILTTKTAAGISIIVINSIGMILSVAIYIGYHRYLKYQVMRMPHHHYFSLVIVMLSFVYGNLLMMDRTRNYCNITSGTSSLILSGYAILLLAKTHLFTRFVRKFILPVSRLSLNSSHCGIMAALMLTHIALLTACLINYPFEIRVHGSKGTREVGLECHYDVGILHLISVLFYPLCLLLVAMIVGFRERGDEQNHEESKFLNFTTIALGIVVIAFFPTFKFVTGIFRSIVLAFIMDVFAFTYIGCLMIPKLYVAFTNRIKGVEQSRVIQTNDS